jgi:pimeloyl-ACP methyl ester carboxylesterase
MLELVQSKGAAAVAEEMIPKLLGETTSAREPKSSTASVAHPRQFTRGDCRFGARADVTARSTPLLADHPRADADSSSATRTRVTPPALSEQMHAAIAGAELTVIPGAGHLTNLEQPELFNAALARFLSHRL